MSRICLAVALGSLLVAARAQAQKEPVAPKSGPPSFAFVHDLDKSQNVVFVQTIEYAPREETRVVRENVEQNGKTYQVERLVKVVVTVPVSRVTKWDAEKGAAINSAGKKISREELFAQLKAGDSILIYWNDLDPLFLKPLKENVVLLQMQSVPTIVPPMKMPEPIPAPKR